MTDRYDQDLLLDYLEGDLDVAARAQVDQMLATDPPLAALMQSLAADRAMMRAIPAEDAPGDLSFDLVQGLERRMLLDAPQVEAGGPIPISRGKGMPPPAGGRRWGRIVGLTGMAAAIAFAAGAVIWFDQFANPLSQTALEMGQANAPTADTMESGAESEEALARDNAGEALTSGAIAPGARGGGLDTTTPGAARNALNEDPASLAERARQAMLDGAAADRAELLEASPAPDTPPGISNDTNPLDLAQPAAVLANVTITAFAPDQALRIESDNQQASMAEVLDWCVRNGVPIVEPQVAYEPDAAAPGEPQIAILIEQAQLDELLTDLNRATIEQRVNRQRAIVDPADEAYYQQARTAPHDAGAAADALDDQVGDNEDASPTIVELRVPEDLGDAVQTRLNVANTLMYSNRAELALAAQRDAEVIRNQQIADESPAAMSRRGGGVGGDEGAQGPGQADDAGGQRSHPFDRNRGGAARGGSRAGDVDGPGGAATETETDQPAERFADGTDEGVEESADDAATPMPEAQEDADNTDEPDANDLEQPGTAPDGGDAMGLDEAEEDTEDAGPPARGNWLLPQVPLAPSTPIWTDPPTAQLVPIVFVRRMLEEATPIESETAPAQAAEPDDAVEE
ncbi:hypothetical protein OT109_04895 [Phycisphaeraceae bacterium D3-23]